MLPRLYIETLNVPNYLIFTMTLPPMAQFDIKHPPALINVNAIENNFNIRILGFLTIYNMTTAGSV